MLVAITIFLTPLGGRSKTWFWKRTEFQTWLLTHVHAHPTHRTHVNIYSYLLLIAYHKTSSREVIRITISKHINSSVYPWWSMKFSELILWRSVRRICILSLESKQTYLSLARWWQHGVQRNNAEFLYKWKENQDSK